MELFKVVILSDCAGFGGLCYCAWFLGLFLWSFFVVLCVKCFFVFFFFSSRRRHTRCGRDWSSDVCSSDLRPLHWLFESSLIKRFYHDPHAPSQSLQGVLVLSFQKILLLIQAFLLRILP